MREPTGPCMEPLPRAAHVLQPVIERAANDPQSGDHTRLADLMDDADLRKAIQAAVDDANRSVSRTESIREFALLPENLTIEAGELTPRLKVRRRVVETHYAHLIDELYGGSSFDLSERSPVHGASA